jgi:hypothetical protein
MRSQEAVIKDSEPAAVTTEPPLFYELLHKLQASLKILPDKPEETPRRCLRALMV